MTHERAMGAIHKMAEYLIGECEDALFIMSAEIFTDKELEELGYDPKELRIQAGMKEV